MHLDTNFTTLSIPAWLSLLSDRLCLSYRLCHHTYLNSRSSRSLLFFSFISNLNKSPNSLYPAKLHLSISNSTSQWMYNRGTECMDCQIKTVPTLAACLTHSNHSPSWTVSSTLRPTASSPRTVAGDNPPQLSVSKDCFSHSLYSPCLEKKLFHCLSTTPDSKMTTTIVCLNQLPLMERGAARAKKRSQDLSWTL